jgi:hypothetical protein
MKDENKIDYPTFYRVLNKHNLDLFHIVQLWKKYQTDEKSFFSCVQFDVKESVLKESLKY